MCDCYSLVMFDSQKYNEIMLGVCPASSRDAHCSFGTTVHLASLYTHTESKPRPQHPSWEPLLLRMSAECEQCCSGEGALVLQHHRHQQPEVLQVRPGSLVMFYCFTRKGRGHRQWAPGMKGCEGSLYCTLSFMALKHCLSLHR